MMEHLQCVRARNAINALGKHAQLHHENEEVDFVTEIIQGNVKFNPEYFIH